MSHPKLRAKHSSFGLDVRKAVATMRDKLHSDSSVESGFFSPRWSRRKGHKGLTEKFSLESGIGSATRSSQALDMTPGSTDSLSALSPSPFAGKMSKMKHFDFWRASSAETRQKSVSEVEEDIERITYLSTKDMHLIVETWNRTRQQRLNFAMSIYEQVFTSKASLKTAYNFRSTPLEQLRQQDTFCHQAQAFADFIDTIVFHVKSNDERALRQAVISMGELHSRLVTAVIEPIWWAVFLKAMLHAIRPFCYSSPMLQRNSDKAAGDRKFKQLKFLKGKMDRQKSESEPELSGESREDPAAIRAWSRLLQNVINTMKEAFERQCKETRGEEEDSK